MKICYLLRDYIGFCKPANAYRACFQMLDIDEVASPDEADVVVLQGLMGDIPQWFNMYPVLKNRYVIGYCVWETDILPSFAHQNIQMVDEIWTPSSFSRDVLRQAHNRIFVVPHIADKPVIVKCAIEKLKQMLDYRDNVYYFYTIGRLSDPRKNVWQTLRALFQVVEPDKVHLVIKDHSVDQQLRGRPFPVPPGMHLIREDFDEPMMGALHSICDCYVSSHCSEGWGLGLSEAMSVGNLVVATGYGGNMDYMTVENSFPIGYRIAPIGSYSAAFSEEWTPNMSWAYVNEKELIDCLKLCINGRQSFKSKRLQAQIDMKAFSKAAVADIIRHRLEKISVLCPGPDPSGLSG